MTKFKLCCYLGWMSTVILTLGALLHEASGWMQIVVDQVVRLPM